MILHHIVVMINIDCLLYTSIPIRTPVIWEQTSNAAISLGGTGLIIVTGVALETTKQIKTLITRKEYHGYIRK